MNDTLVKGFASKFKNNTTPVGVGQRVRVHQKVIEGEKERVQVFDGLVIKKRGGRSTDGSFTVRKISEGVGVEKIFPLHSPSVIKVEILRQHKIKRSKLYFMRDRFGKAARLKEDKSFDLEKEQKKLENFEKLEKKKLEKEKISEPVEEKEENTEVKDSTPKEENPETQDLVSSEPEKTEKPVADQPKEEEKEGQENNQKKSTVPETKEPDSERKPEAETPGGEKSEKEQKEEK